MTKEILLISLFFCHFLADYTPLSTPRMLNAKRLGTPLWPIFNHALVHAVLMGLVLWIYTSDERTIAYLFLMQLLTHFLIDVWKGRMNVWFPSLQSPATKGHWVIFGFDQFLHAVVIILMTAFASS